MKKLILTFAITFVTISLSAQFTENPTGVLTTFDRVGINTTNLDPDYKLTVQGNMNIGGTTNSRLKVRHIDGKHYANANIDDLFLNYNNGKNVHIGKIGAATNAKSDLFVSGNLGINTANPDTGSGYNLTVQGNANIGGTGNAVLKVRHIDGKAATSTAKDHLHLNWNNGKDVIIGTHNNTGLKSDLFVSGRVRIGNDLDMPTGYQLYVKEGILTEKVKVALKNTGDWADYVFAEDYQLNSIETVEEFVKENKHLPNIPSAETVVENGINVAEMDAKLLRQIEELWLHTIEINKEKEALQTKYENLQNDFSALYKRVAELEQK